MTAVDGIVTYTNLSHNVANTITIQFASGGILATSTPVVITALAAEFSAI